MRLYTKTASVPCRVRTPCVRSLQQAEAEGLEPPRACARRISSAVPYQLGLRLQNRAAGARYASRPMLVSSRSSRSAVTGLPTESKSGRLDLNQRPLRPERSALPG